MSAAICEAPAFNGRPSISVYFGQSDLRIASLIISAISSRLLEQQEDCQEKKTSFAIVIPFEENSTKSVNLLRGQKEVTNHKERQPFGFQSSWSSGFLRHGEIDCPKESSGVD
jgi:hypothetical protein